MSTQTRVRELSRAPLTLDDLTADLLWPRLLRAASLAFNPPRLGIAFFMVVLLMLVGELADAIVTRRGDAGADGPTLGALAVGAVNALLDGVARLNAPYTASALYNAFIVAPSTALTNFPVATLIATALGLLIFAVGGGAICRMAACEHALGMSVSWPQGLAFGISRLGSTAGALLGPAVVVWVIALLIALGGLLLRVPVLNVAGGLLFGVAMVLSLVAMLVMIAFVVGHLMLIPAVACDGADAIDAIQRAYAYVFGRPLRLAIYLLVLFLEALVILFIVRIIAWGVEIFSVQSAAAIAGEAGRDVLRGIDAPDTQTAERVGGTGAAAAWIIRLWMVVLMGLVWAYALNFYFSASTLLYLAMRRITDGQDMHELWLPGLVGGTSAEQSAPAPATSAPGATEGGPVA